MLINEETYWCFILYFIILYILFGIQKAFDKTKPRSNQLKSICQRKHMYAFCELFKTAGWSTSYPWYRSIILFSCKLFV